MGLPILLLRLEGPLQSWGTRSRWDVRDTAPEPTKSGVVGLLGCAVGYARNDPRLEELDAALRFGVRVEHPGRVVVDYQTVTDYLPTAAGGYKYRGLAGQVVGPPAKLRAQGLPPATIVSPRAYLEDASFLVALAQRDGGRQTLEQCVRALQRPRWPLFLGRKACIPTRPVCEALTDQYASLETALRNHPWCWLGREGIARSLGEGETPSPLQAWIETPPEEPTAGTVQRQDALRLNPARAYGFVNLRSLRVDFPGVQKGVTPCSTSAN